MSSKKRITVALVSLGCPKNLVDSEKMMAMLAQAGCVVGAPVGEADVIVVNTCGFIQAAKDESLAVIREALGHKAGGRARRVVVAGCLSNRDGPELLKSLPGVDAIIGVNNREDIVAAVCGTGVPPVSSSVGYAHREDEETHGRDAHATLDDAGRFRLTPRHTAYLRISEGCSQKCTFCTIPAIRGPFRSKAPAQVLAEARELVSDGAIELNIIGQDTTSYGMDLGRGVTLARLLRQLERIDGLRWIRLLYAYPMRFGDSLVRLIGDSEKILPYVDLPLQHISDSVLRRMGRRVARQTIVRLLESLKRQVPGIVIRSTFIVGFPGESDEDFQELLAFIKEFRFGALGVFEFSPEKGTPAARLDHAVPAEVKHRRAEDIMLAQQKIVAAANQRMIGKRIDVLVDGQNAAGQTVGRYYGQAPDIDGLCIFKKTGSGIRGSGSESSGLATGQIVSSKVVGFDNYDLIVSK
jgi:ribosomal protein S12 methylthiotransferase